MCDDLHVAVRHHQGGHLEQAARIYQALLTRQPDQAEALHLLGVVALQQGDPPRAAELMGRAVAVNPSVAAFHANLAEAYRALGQPERAAGCCQVALRLQPHYPEAANNLGLALLAQGKPEAAAAQFRAALRLRPGVAMAHNNLANALRPLGQKAQAVEQFRQALRLDPGLAEAHSNLGQLLLELHRFDEAAVHCREAVRLRPNFPEAHNNLGNVFRAQGQLPQARACYAEALRLNPDLALTYNNIGQALQEEGQLDDALLWYQKALQLEPHSARIHCNLAGALREQDEHAEALAGYQRALQLDPDYAEAHHGLGTVLHDQGRLQEALGCYREALRRRADFAPAHASLGRAQEELGEFDAAAASVRAALRHDPHHAGAYGQLATLLRAKLPEADRAAMQQQLADPRLPAGQRLALHFGLAQVHDAQGAYDQAAAHLARANALRRAEWQKRGQGYDPAEHARFVDDLIATYTPAFFEGVRGFGLPTERPVFIVGLPRSGTTLVEQILASHPQVFGAGELRLVRDTFEALPRAMGRAATPLECVRALDRATAGELARQHLDRLGRLNEEAARVADKMPDNYLHLGLIATLFPRATLIHCRRDLRDVAVSCWMTNFQHIRWAFDQDHIAARFHEYRRVMEHWRRVLPVPLVEVDYEETVADLEGVARRLVAACGLGWEPACLAFHQTRRPVRTASVTQVRQPIYRRSVGRWRHYESALAPLWAQLGGGQDLFDPDGTQTPAGSPGG
jgi:tetratricopeptide (TPR) repeat protein